MEGVERTNVVMVCLNQWTGFIPYNPHTMDMDKGRNCYSCGVFGHLE